MKKRLILIILSLMLVNSSALAKEQLTWLVVHWPPFQMLEGADQGKGSYDALLNLYRKNMPQYEHKTIKMNWARFWNDLKEGKKVCNMFAIKTEEREQFAEFSQVVSILLPLRVIMRKKSIQKLGNPQSISVADLLQDASLKGIYVTKRSYNQEIDELLKKHHENIKSMAIEDKNIIQMLLSQRTDYTVEYPYVINYLAKSYQKAYTTQLGSVGIKELPDFATSHLACPKNDWGRKVIRDFDHMLAKVKITPEYLSTMQMWHTDLHELELIEQEYKNVFLGTN